MPAFDLTDPALRREWGLVRSGSETVSKRSQWWRKPKQEHRDRAGTKTAILEVLSASEVPLSRREILCGIGRSKSPWLLDVLAEMVTLGQLIEHESSYRNVLMFVYEVADAAR